ncbi:MAG: hypothetical protein HYV97_01350 [Bdellovibrio sp.]|nr:hypothetical protein [Bdellovibrio sp.]
MLVVVLFMGDPCYQNDLTLGTRQYPLIKIYDPVSKLATNPFKLLKWQWKVMALSLH